MAITVRIIALLDFISAVQYMIHFIYHFVHCNCNLNVSSTETLRALRSSSNMCPCNLGRIGIWQCWLFWRGENWSTHRKTSWSKERTKNRAPVAQLVEHRAVMREVVGSNPSWINTQDLKITEEKVLPS